jgi:hypothetical protein
MEVMNVTDVVESGVKHEGKGNIEMARDIDAVINNGEDIRQSYDKGEGADMKCSRNIIEEREGPNTIHKSCTQLANESYKFTTRTVLQTAHNSSLLYLIVDPSIKSNLKTTFKRLWSWDRKPLSDRVNSNQIIVLAVHHQVCCPSQTHFIIRIFPC